MNNPTNIRQKYEISFGHFFWGQGHLFDNKTGDKKSDDSVNLKQVLFEIQERQGKFSRCLLVDPVSKCPGDFYALGDSRILLRHLCL